jgi:hypothetical protein
VQLTFQTRMRQFIAYSSGSLDRSFEMHPPESRSVSSCADASAKNIIDCGFFRHLNFVAGSVHRCLAATSIGVVFGSGPN